MNGKAKMLIAVLFSIVVIMAAFHLLGCCDSCCDDDDDDDDDYSVDTSSDGSSSTESSTSLDDDSSSGSTRAAGVCDGISTNSASASASVSTTESQNVYSYSYSIKACGSPVGFNLVLKGATTKVISSGTAPRSVETTGSNSYEDTATYSQFCLNTGDSSIGEKCVTITGR
jgi:hypothetical protein